MDDLFDALGWRNGPLAWLAILVAVAATAAGVATAGYLLGRLIGVPAWLLQAVLWLPWLVWLSSFFPRHYRTTLGSGAYRRGFVRHVVPGISWNFGQMARPTLVGLVSGGRPFAQPWPATAGLALVVGGSTLVVLAVRSIGVQHALFLGEYLPTSRRLTTTGVYRVLRHPMFLGGMAISVGLSLVFFSPQTLSMDLATVVVLPLYRLSEDARCRRVYTDYDRYRRLVSGLVPRWSNRPLSVEQLGHRDEEPNSADLVRAANRPPNGG